MLALAKPPTTNRSPAMNGLATLLLFIAILLPFAAWGEPAAPYCFRKVGAVDSLSPAVAQCAART